MKRDFYCNVCERIERYSETTTHCPYCEGELQAEPEITQEDLDKWEPIEEILRKNGDDCTFDEPLIVLQAKGLIPFGKANNEKSH